MQNHISTPFVVEIAGMPVAGKTTVAEQLCNLAVESDVEVQLVEEAAEKAPLQRWKRGWQFNAWTLCHTVKRILEEQAAHNFQLLIIDRGVYDVLCWVHWFSEHHHLDPGTASALRSFARIPQWFQGTSLVVHLRVSVREALRRRATRGRIINQETLQELEDTYSTVMDDLRSSQPPDTDYLQVDTASNPPGVIVKKIAIHLREQHGFSALTVPD